MLPGHLASASNRTSVSVWISTSIALAALGFSLWTWYTNRRDSTKRDQEARPVCRGDQRAGVRDLRR
jgi:hypothetical protein